GMPDIGIAGRKGNHDSGILPSFVERAGQCLQPEVEPRSSDEPGRGSGAPGATLLGRAVASTVSQPGGQPRNQVRALVARSLQLLPLLDCHPVPVAAALIAISRGIARL